jgi:hypothetical protein
MDDNCRVNENESEYIFFAARVWFQELHLTFLFTLNVNESGI